MAAEGMTDHSIKSYLAATSAGFRLAGCQVVPSSSNWLRARAGGDALCGSRALFRGQDPPCLGGFVDVIAGVVHQPERDAGGGTALIGGDEHGTNSAIPDADQTYLGPGATITADALTFGNGGKIILWGNESTQAYGTISARGGAQGGNGGLVETSAHYLDVQTTPNLAAPNGTGGTWLLDPYDLTISTGSTTGITTSAPFTFSSSLANLNVTDLQTRWRAPT